MPYLLLALCVLFWSGNVVLGRGVHSIIPPVSINFWRWTLAFIILLMFAHKQVYRQGGVIARHWKVLCILGALSVVCYNTLLYMALNYNSVTNTILINSMIPVFILVESWIGFRDKISFQQTLGGLISFIGLGWILARGSLTVLTNLTFSKGDLLTLAAAASWAGYTVLLRLRPKDLSSVSFVTAIAGFGSILMLPLYLLEVSFKGTFLLIPASIGTLAYMAIFSSVLALLLWNKGVAAVGPNKAGFFIHLNPVYSIILAYIFLGETLQRYHYPGMVLIILGLFLVATGKRLDTAPPDNEE